MRTVIAIVIVLAGLVAATPASAAGCRVTADGAFPGVWGLQATGTGCVTANAVAQGIQDAWARHSRFPAQVRTWERPREAAGRRLTWRCRYRMVAASWGPEGWMPPYMTARCARLDAVVSIASLHS